MRNIVCTLAGFAILAACQPADLNEPAPAPVPAAEVPADPLAAAISGDWRSPEEKARDVWRHPQETLTFFGVKPQHKVVEVWPGGGWYTNILAPYLASGGGTLVAAGLDPSAIKDDAERRARAETRLAEFKKAYSDPRYGVIEHSAFSNVSGPLTAPGTADAVLTFRNVHNWMGQNYADKFFRDAYAALKPGGVLGVVEHRLPSAQTQDPTAASGYVHEDYVKSLAAAAGFQFIDGSEINANPADTADHPCGVWSLPPVSRAPTEDCAKVENYDPAKYKAIGESDRMTLKFVKPESAPD
jgi:predicted methyltransferase